MRGLELRHEDVFPPSVLHLSRIGRLDEQRDGLLQVLQGVLARVVLSAMPTEGEREAIFDILHIFKVVFYRWHCISTLASMLYFDCSGCIEAFFYK